LGGQRGGRKGRKMVKGRWKEGRGNVWNVGKVLRKCVVPTWMKEDSTTACKQFNGLIAVTQNLHAQWACPSSGKIVICQHNCVLWCHNRRCEGSHEDRKGRKIVKQNGGRGRRDVRRGLEHRKGRRERKQGRE